MIVDGVSCLLDGELAGGRVLRADEGEEKAAGGTGKLASLKPTVPTHVRVATKDTPTRRL